MLLTVGSPPDISAGQLMNLSESVYPGPGALSRLCANLHCVGESLRVSESYIDGSSQVSSSFAPSSLIHTRD